RPAASGSLLALALGSRGLEGLEPFERGVELLVQGAGRVAALLDPRQAAGLDVLEHVERPAHLLAGLLELGVGEVEPHAEARLAFGRPGRAQGALEIGAEKSLYLLEIGLAALKAASHHRPADALVAAEGRVLGRARLLEGGVIGAVVLGGLLLP